MFNENDSIEILFIKTTLIEMIATIYLMIICFLKTDLTYVADPVIQQKFKDNTFYNFIYGISLWGIVTWSIKFSLLYIIYKYFYSYPPEFLHILSKELLYARKYPIITKIVLTTVLIFLPPNPDFLEIFLRFPLLFEIFRKPINYLALIILLILSMAEVIGYLSIMTYNKKPLFYDFSWIIIVIFLSIFLPV